MNYLKKHKSLNRSNNNYKNNNHNSREKQNQKKQTNKQKWNQQQNQSKYKIIILVFFSISAVSIFASAEPHSTTSASLVGFPM